MSVSLGILSWKAPRTLAATLETYAAGDLFAHVDEARVFFQEITEADRDVAARYGLRAEGSDRNLGIEGGVRALVEGTDAEFLLLLENDCPLIETPEATRVTLARAVADMGAHDLAVIRLRSRRDPGEQFTRAEKYQTYFDVLDPIETTVPIRRPCPVCTGARYAMRFFKARRLIGQAVYLERDPAARHPREIRPTAHGNWMTDSRYEAWTNQSILVRRSFMRDTVLPGVAAHPSKRTIAGVQDIERAANRRWWRALRARIGYSAPGLFTHRRLDR